jgi:hypothetical protein
MKKIISLICLLSSICTGTTIAQKFEPKEELKGKIKSVKKSYFFAEMQGGKLVITSRINQEPIYREDFDRKGNKVKADFYDHDTDQVFATDTYHYHDGRLVYISYSLSDSYDSLWYDASGNLQRIKKKVVYYPGTDMELIEYEEEIYITKASKSLLSESREYNADMKMYRKYQYTYDQKGNLKEEKLFGKVFEDDRTNYSLELKRRLTYVYDQNNKPVKANTYLPKQSNPVSYETFEYGENGLLKKRTDHTIKDGTTRVDNRVDGQ